MNKITDWCWQLPVESKKLKSQGWEKYQIVNHGTSYSVSLIKGDSIRTVEGIASNVETIDIATDLIAEYDCDEIRREGAAFALITCFGLLFFFVGTMIYLLRA